MEMSRCPRGSPEGKPRSRKQVEKGNRPEREDARPGETRAEDSWFREGQQHERGTGVEKGASKIRPGQG